MGPGLALLFLLWLGVAYTYGTRWGRHTCVVVCSARTAHEPHLSHPQARCLRKLARMLTRTLACTLPYAHTH